MAKKMPGRNTASQKMPRQRMDMDMPSADQMRRMMDAADRMHMDSGRPVKKSKRK